MEKYISQCIESVISQKYHNIEIIISDNCSTDGTVGIIKSYLYDKRIKFYQNKINLGMHSNTEICLNYSTGEFVAFLSSDDYWNDETYLSQAVDKIVAFDDIVMFCGGKKVLHEKTKTFQDLSDGTNDIFDGKEIFLKGLDAWPLLEIGAMVIKTNLLKNIISDMEHHYYADDVYIFWRLCLMGKLYMLRKPFLAYRVHDDNACRWKSVDDFINRILCNAVVPIKAYEVGVKKNMFSKQVLDKWLVKNVLLFMMGSYMLEWDKFNILKNAYESILAERGFSIEDFGIDSLFSRLHEVNILENKVYYCPQDIKIEEITNFGNDNDYSISALKNGFELAGYLKYNTSIRVNLMKSGINENSINDFFDVFIYSKIYLYPPAELQSLNFSTGGIGVFEQINVNASKIINIGSDNADIFGSGWILNSDKTSFDKIYIVLSINDQLKYFIEAIAQERRDIAAVLALKSGENCGYYFVIPKDNILTGQYDIITIAIKGNEAIVFDNNKKIIF
jgi:glycosyltransferase involved in cell wall biosynthesis